MKRVLILVALFSTPVLAQQQQSTAVDRVSLALGQCVGNFEQRIDEIAELRKQLSAAQERIKELEPKPEPKD